MQKTYRIGSAQGRRRRLLRGIGSDAGRPCVRPAIALSLNITKPGPIQHDCGRNHGHQNKIPYCIHCWLRSDWIAMYHRIYNPFNPTFDCPESLGLDSRSRILSSNNPFGVKNKVVVFIVHVGRPFHHPKCLFNNSAFISCQIEGFFGPIFCTLYLS